MLRCLTVVCFVSGVLIDDLPMLCAFAGDNVVLTVTGIDMSNVTVGKPLVPTVGKRNM